MTTVPPPPLERAPAGTWPVRQLPAVDSLDDRSASSITPGHGRIDVVHAVAGLRHIEASGEPAMVFSHLAAVCVPSVCDEIVIDLVENGHGYRIRRPGHEATALRSIQPIPPGAERAVLVSADSVTAAVPGTPVTTNGATFAGTVMCTWTDGYRPTPTDAALVQLMVDHAAALVQREPFTSPGHGQRRGTSVAAPAPGSGRIADAVGVVMALHHVDRAQAMNLLIRISERSRVGLLEVADSVASTGSLTVPRRSVTRS